MTLIRLLLLKWIIYGENLWRGQTGAKENISKWNRGSPRPATSSLLSVELPVVAGAPGWPVPAYCAQDEEGLEEPRSR